MGNDSSFGATSGNGNWNGNNGMETGMIPRVWQGTGTINLISSLYEASIM